MVIPEEAGTGHAPQSLAKAASERIRSGLSPKIITIAAAVLAPTAKPSRRVGDVSAVSRARCRSCVVISSARVSQRRASDRSVCFPDATGVSSGPGRSPAQRVTSARSVRAYKGSRSTGGALTRICLSVLIAVVRAQLLRTGVVTQCQLLPANYMQLRRAWGGIPSPSPRARTTQDPAGASALRRLPGTGRRVAHGHGSGMPRGVEGGLASSTNCRPDEARFYTSRAGAPARTADVALQD